MKYFEEGVLKYFKISMKFLNISKWIFHRASLIVSASVQINVFDYNVYTRRCAAKAVITTAIQQRYDYDPTTIRLRRDIGYKRSRIVSLYHNYDSTTTRLRHDDTTTHSTTTEVIGITICVRFDCDTTMIRLRRIARACFHSTPFDASKKWSVNFLA